MLNYSILDHIDYVVLVEWGGQGRTIILYVYGGRGEVRKDSKKD